MHHCGAKPIQTLRLTLRPLTLNDVPAMYDGLFSDPAVTEFFSWPTHTDIAQTLQDVETCIANYSRPDYYNWAIVLDGALIGEIGVSGHNEKNRNCDVYYRIASAHWGQGYMTEALRAVIDYLFCQVGFHRIVCRHDVRNAASGIVMKKCGMEYEGTFRQHRLRKDGTWGDMMQYAMLNPADLI